MTNQSFFKPEKLTARLRARLRVLVLLAIDTSLLVFTWVTSLWLRYSEGIDQQKIGASLPLLALAFVLLLLCLKLFKVYRISHKHFHGRAALKLVVMVITLSLMLFFVNLIWHIAPRTVPLIFALLFALSMLASRVFIYMYFNRAVFLNLSPVPKVVIFGAGSAGVQLAVALRNAADYQPLYFADDNPALWDLNIAGLRVLSRDKLKEKLKKKNIQFVLLAIPSLERSQRMQLSKELQSYGCTVRQLPSYVELLRNKSLISSLSEVTPEDLIGRELAFDDINAIEKGYEGCAVLVTGAGGSIGSEICRQLYDAGVCRLVMLEQCEYNLFAIDAEIRAKTAQNHAVEVVSVLGSILDEQRVAALLLENKIDTIIHAAAYKHVPLIEDHPIEALRNNVMGTHVLAQAALKADIERFLFISTDKAVRPSSKMGASKRLAELLLQDSQARANKTLFTIVRFGNVLGSSGSVIPIFRKQIAAGGPVTLTHPDITRYFMTINEAVRLVLLAAQFKRDNIDEGEGTDVMVLDMGEPVKIIELAERMISFAPSVGIV